MNKSASSMTYEVTASSSTSISRRRTSKFFKLLKQLPLIGKMGLVFLIVLHLVVFLGPIFVHQSPTATNPLVSLGPASAQHVLGTDELGRDEFARMLAGGRITLTVGLTAMVLALCIGGFLGAIAGFFGGVTEMIVIRLVDLMMSIPSFFLVLVEITAFGHSPGVVILVVGLTFWPQIARVVYAEVLKYRSSPLVEAEVTVGANPWRILFRHVLLQSFSSVIVLMTLGIGWSILTESGLSYLGLGIQPPLASWGSMLQNSQSYIWTDPALAIYPGVVILLTVLAYNLFGEALRDVLDPKLRGSESRR